MEVVTLIVYIELPGAMNSLQLHDRERVDVLGMLYG